MAAASTSETSVNFYKAAQRYIPEDGHLHATKVLFAHVKTFCHFA
jgi:hypothetical protein